MTIFIYLISAFTSEGCIE